MKTKYTSGRSLNFVLWLDVEKFLLCIYSVGEVNDWNTQNLKITSQSADKFPSSLVRASVALLGIISEIPTKFQIKTVELFINIFSSWN